MPPDPAKIQALQDLPTPNSWEKHQSVLGLINYPQPFIPGLSASTDAAFQCLKAWICQTFLSATYAYYDKSKPIVVQADASEYGLGATLIHSGHPIAFASKMLTDVETCYANIEQECLLVCFCLEKFHTYLCGRHVIVENDYKPLEMIQHKYIHMAPPGFNRCFCTCRSITIPSSISPAKTWY